MSGKAVEKRSSRRKGCTHMDEGIRLIRTNCVCPPKCACRKGDGCTSDVQGDAPVEFELLSELPEGGITDWHLMSAVRLKEFIKEGHLIKLIMCVHKVTGAQVAVLCGVLMDESGKENIYPLAKMFDGDAYDELLPPDCIAVMKPGDTN